MTREQFWESFRSPIPNAILKKYPKGNIFQYWGESAALYSLYFHEKNWTAPWLAGHSGLDFVTFEGDNIVASHDGLVYAVENNPNLGGNCVRIQSDQFTDGSDVCYAVTSYGHLKEVSVKQGQYVKAGDLIGTEGNTGFVVSGNTPYWGDAPAGKGVHLHFSYCEFILKDGSYVYRHPNLCGNTLDPLPIITYKNPDFSGIQNFLIQLRSATEYYKRKYGL